MYRNVFRNVLFAAAALVGACGDPWAGPPDYCTYEQKLELGARPGGGSYTFQVSANGKDLSAKQIESSHFTALKISLDSSAKPSPPTKVCMTLTGIGANTTLPVDIISTEWLGDRFREYGAFYKVGDSYCAEIGEKVITTCYKNGAALVDISK